MESMKIECNNPVLVAIVMTYAEKTAWNATILNNGVRKDFGIQQVAVGSDESSYLRGESLYGIS